LISGVLALACLLTATPLIDAIRQGDEAAAKALLETRVDVNAPAGDGATALHWAVYQDEKALVDLLLAAGANVNAANDLGITPLYLAAANGSAGIVRALLAKRADPAASSETGVTPLMEAARSGSVDAVRALLGGGADVNGRERERGQTALMWAVARRHPAVVKVLLEHRADVHMRTRVRPLTVMLDQGPRRTVKTSMQDARQIEAGGSTALLFAAQAGDAESAALLLGAGADVNDASADGNSALVLATFAGHPAVARVLIDGGANVDAAGAGYSALHAAVLRGDLTTLRALLNKGADVNAQLTKGSPVRRFGSQWALPSTLKGATPLLVAATYLEVEMLRILLAAGANHTLALADGTTPFLAAAGTPVEKEARPSDLERWNIIDNDTPQVPRAEDDVVAALTLLLDSGADIDQTNDAGDSALHAAAGAGMVKVIQLLADRGARLDVMNKAGQTPLDLTLPRGRNGGQPQAEAVLRKLGTKN
jgi:ankyrin repeat protein